MFPEFPDVAREERVLEVLGQAVAEQQREHDRDIAEPGKLEVQRQAVFETFEVRAQCTRPLGARHQLGSHEVVGQQHDLRLDEQQALKAGTFMSLGCSEGSDDRGVVTRLAADYLPIARVFTHGPMLASTSNTQGRSPVR